ARGLELLERLVGGVDVLAVVLVVVQLHDLAADVRLERGVVVTQVGKNVAGHDDSVRTARRGRYSQKPKPPGSPSLNEQVPRFFRPPKQSLLVLQSRAQTKVAS